MDITLADTHSQEDPFEGVGTVDVQILLTWFFDTADPAEVAQYEMPDAA
ncbi:MAG: hypothetical protein H7123_03255 [Thermoleophilia bacterium]|nr:hypothetical protein [Thermoleophilia bacterium]